MIQPVGGRKELASKFLLVPRLHRQFKKQKGEKMMNAPHPVRHLHPQIL